ncbi:hypothetical protein U1Q18_002638 [Sarracenia purpurea var. burkii]
MEGGESEADFRLGGGYSFCCYWWNYLFLSGATGFVPVAGSTALKNSSNMPPVKSSPNSIKIEGPISAGFLYICQNFPDS